jgi:ribonuclease-3
MRKKGRNVGAADTESGLSELETALGYTFLRPELLECALTHRSLAHQRAQAEGSAQAGALQDNERLEFLGDAVLSLVVAEALYAAHPEWREGELTRIRSGLVSRQHMAQVAQAIRLGRHLRLSRAEERSGLRNKDTVLSNSMEAVVGALYLDGGLEAVRTFVRCQVMGEAADRLADELRSGAALGNYKSALQERLQASGAGAPVYRVKGESGPDHHKHFLVEVRSKGEAAERGKPLARGTGRTKKLAEQDAARRALSLLNESAGAANTGTLLLESEPDRSDESGSGNASEFEFDSNLEEPWTR